MDKSKFWLLMLLIVQRKNLAVIFWYLWFWCPRYATSRVWWIGQETKIYHSSAATLRINLGILIFPSGLMRKTLWTSWSNQISNPLVSAPDFWPFFSLWQQRKAEKSCGANELNSFLHSVTSCTAVTKTMIKYPYEV